MSRYDSDSASGPSHGPSRRGFLKLAGGAAAAAGLTTTLGSDLLAYAAARDERALPAPNSGRPISLTMWNPYGAADLPIYKRWIQSYQRAYPNVTIKLVTLPWAAHWAKLQAAVEAGSGPDIDLMHHDIYGQYYDAGLMVPYPESLFPLSQIKQEYDLRGQLASDGKMYLFPIGPTLGMIYYNTEIWRSAGLTAKDIPTTWDDLGRVAQHLTVRKNGAVKRYGFNLGAISTATGFLHDFVPDPYYQQGVYMFSADGRKALFGNAQMVKAIQTHQSFFTTYKAASYSGQDGVTQFGNGVNAMTWCYPWLPSYLTSSAPTIKAGAFPLPNYTGAATGPYGRGDVAARFGVMTSASPAKRETAFHFLHWLFMTGNRVTTALTYANFEGALPAYKPAQSRATTVGLDVINKVKDRAVFLGDFPQATQDALDKAIQEIELKGVSSTPALAPAVQTTNRALLFRPYLFTERETKL